MMWRILLGLWGAMGTLGAVWMATNGQATTAEVLDGVVGLGALLALFAVEKLTRDREVLTGLRAFPEMVRSG